MQIVKPASIPWLEIHLATLMFGVAGLFGKFVELPALYIVMGRAMFAFLALSLVLGVTRIPFTLHKRRDIVLIGLMGGLLALHWFSFFFAIQISSVAIGLLAFASFPVFVTAMEPFFFKEKYQLASLCTALVTTLGVFLVVPVFDIGNLLTQGVLWGVLSGFTFAVIALLNRKYVQSYPGTLMSFYQNGIACMCLLPLLSVTDVVNIKMQDWFNLILLGVVFTALAHTLFIRSMKSIKAQQASIVISLEPVYGIVFAVWLLNEVPSMRTLSGGSLIIGAALYTSIRR